MGGKIECYVDCVSPYSYFAFLHLRRNREALKAHNIDIEFHPVFLGGINQGSGEKLFKVSVHRHKPVLITCPTPVDYLRLFLTSDIRVETKPGNKPPWTLEAKAKYLRYDRERAVEYFNTPNVKTPDVFPIVSLLPQRAQTYIKHTYPDKLEPVFLTLWHYLWESNRDVSKPDVLSSVLAEHFSQSQVEEVLKAAQTPEWKQALNDKTKEALDRGAFGAPWFWVRSERGGQIKEEPFFGSDRFTVMWQFLGVNWRDVEILKPGETSNAKL